MSTFYTENNMMLLLEKFNQRSLTKLEWTHHAHLTIAILHIREFGFFDAVCRLRSGIILLNQSHETQNTANGGYHETLTISWSKIIEVYLTLIPNLPLEQLVNGFLNSTLADRNLPFEFYSKEKLLSSDYRSVYKTQDLKEISELSVNEILRRDKIQI